MAMVPSSVEQRTVVRGHRKRVTARLIDREEAVPADAEVRRRGGEPASLDCIGRCISVDAGQGRPAARFAGEVFRLQSTRRCERQVRDLQTRGEGECRDNGPEKHALCAYSSPTVRRALLRPLLSHLFCFVEPPQPSFRAICRKVRGFRFHRNTLRCAARSALRAHDILQIDDRQQWAISREPKRRAAARCSLLRVAKTTGEKTTPGKGRARRRRAPDGSPAGAGKAAVLRLFRLNLTVT